MKAKLLLTLAVLALRCHPGARADSFFVTNFGINTITRYDKNGSGSLFTKSFVNGPTGITLDGSGNVYVATADDTIRKFSADGTDLGVFTRGSLSNPIGLAFDREGRLYVASFAGNSVRRFAADGSDLGIFASVTQPTGLAFDVAGNLHVASLTNSILRFTAEGAALASITSPTLNQPEGLAFDSSGVLFVANNVSNTVEMFSPAGLDLGPAPATFGGSSASSVPESSTQVHIAFRTDGLPGDGSLRDPFDGSTQPKLDAIFKSYYDAGATNITFHIGPGTFQMKGAWDYDWALLTGWHIKGAGRSLTIVQQVVGVAGVNPGSNGALFGNGWALNYANQSVEDLTADCAWFRSGPGGDSSRPHGNFQGINLYGENATIRNVSVTGCGWQDNECFAILTSGGVNDEHLPDNALYENVEVSEGATGIYSTHLTGMAMINLAAMGNDPTPVYARNGRIINCTFDLPDAGNAGGMPAGYESGIVTGSTFIGYHHGMFHDTFVSKNITVVGNTIKALYPDSNGILFNSGAGNTPCENISIIGNTLFSAGGIGFASAIKNSTILGNRIRRAPGNNADYGIFLDTASVQNISVSQNSIDAGLPYLSRNTTGCSFTTNRTPEGAVAIPDSATLPSDEPGYGSVLEPIGLNGPLGLAFDGQDNLHVVNALRATVDKFSADGTEDAVVSTGFSPAFIAVQRTPRLANISTRLHVQTGERIAAGGFIISGTGTKTLLIRGLGPSLAGAGVDGVLADPTLELHGGANNALLASNDNWAETQQGEIETVGLAPGNPSESVIIATLSAGAYTVLEQGKGSATGVGLIEIYDLDSETGPELGNISTRGFVGSGLNVMIAGFITASGTGGSGEVLIRALGPSLGAAGVSGSLGDPVLELRDHNGALIATNDSWKSEQEAEINATGIAPPNDGEAAILTTLAPGAYTAIASGRGGTSGVGLIEVYNLH